MELDFSVSSIAAGFVFGVIGLYLLKAARRNANFWHAIIAIVLMIYPYFITGDYLPWVIGFALCGGAYITR